MPIVTLSLSLSLSLSLWFLVQGWKTYNAYVIKYPTHMQLMLFKNVFTEFGRIVPVTAQLPGANGYTGGKVVFLDTENTLYPCTTGKILR